MRLSNKVVVSSYSNLFPIFTRFPETINLWWVFPPVYFVTAAIMMVLPMDYFCELKATEKKSFFLSVYVHLILLVGISEVS